MKSEHYREGSATVSFSDNGTGIASQDLDRIFKPLFTTKSEGMGMGLAICRSIIEAHEGRLWAQANEPRGAIFVLRWCALRRHDKGHRDRALMNA